MKDVLIISLCIHLVLISHLTFGMSLVKLDLIVFKKFSFSPLSVPAALPELPDEQLLCLLLK